MQNFVDTDAYMCASETCSVTGTVVVNRTSRPPEPWPAAAVAIMDAAGARPGRVHPDAAHACRLKADELATTRRRWWDQ